VPPQKAGSTARSISTRSPMPVGISFVGTAWSEPKLIAMAYAFEQATKHRRAPGYSKTETP